jgi:adenylate cyclase
VFIVLSTLRLDFALSAFTGLVAAVQFGALSLPLRRRFRRRFARMSAPNFVLAKATVLLLCGIVAGLVRGAAARARSGARSARCRSAERVISAFGQQVSPQIVEELLKQGPRS